jgi:hypothetical protein
MCNIIQYKWPACQAPNRFKVQSFRFKVAGSALGETATAVGSNQGRATAEARRRREEQKMTLQRVIEPAARLGG